MLIRLVKPDNAPNFCFLILSQRERQLHRGSQYHGWNYGRALKKPQWPNPADDDYGKRTQLIQVDLDLLSVARTFGWNMRDLQRIRPGKAGRLNCDHRGTDGTVACPNCLIAVDVFIASAQAYLDANIGKMVEDPGYFE